ncbi:hypothetical protein ACH5RR_007246 [Cinchona calisaya]|uniref:DUF4283 domain-containing protein n=1 Tax=Cinchona calisaya TaxID=153742 RepID=A0ABD3ARB7_9GENT
MGHYLTVRKWSPNFKPSEDAINTTLVWVWFSGLPIEYFIKDTLLHYDNALGRAVNTNKLLMHLEENMSGECSHWQDVCRKTNETNKPKTEKPKLNNTDVIMEDGDCRKSFDRGDPKLANLDQVEKAPFVPWMIASSARKSCKKLQRSIGGNDVILSNFRKEGNMRGKRKIP